MQPRRMLLLGILSSGEQPSDRVEGLVEQHPLGAWLSDDVGWVAAEIASLVATGLLESVVPGHQGPPNPAIIRITAKGRAALQRALQEAWQTPPEPFSTPEIAALLMGALGQGDQIVAMQRRLEQLIAGLQRLERVDLSDRFQREMPEEWRSILQTARERMRREISWLKQLIRRHPTRAAQPSSSSPQPVAESGARKRAGEGRLGAFTFVLHSHLPYCRKAGRWPHGEEWLHEAMAETYVPLLDALYDLRDEGVPFRLTIGLTPILTEQLADADVLEHFGLYLDEEIQAASQDVSRFAREPNPQLMHLASFYRDLYQGIKASFTGRYGGDIVGAFRQLQDEGYIEIVTSAATHGYLPLLSRDASIYAQLRCGVESYRRHFGRAPRAIWLPECAYRPAYVDASGVTRPPLEDFLAALGITCFFVETHAIEGGRPVGKAAGEVAIGPYAAIRRRYVVPVANEPTRGGTTFSAYYALGSDRGLTTPPVAAIGRNNRTGQQVWAADWGYPGEADYREFHKKDHESGLQYWRVTGPDAGLGDKDEYHPEWAATKVEQHAHHYAHLVQDLLTDYNRETGEYGLVASNYDTELFGHWWFEGIAWIKKTLADLSESDLVDLATASSYLDSHPPEMAMALPESSWGAGGTHWTWDNPETHWMWGPIYEAELRMESLAALDAEDGPLAPKALAQAARELLLTESSDWPFLVTTGQAKQYAIERFQSHLSRFHKLADLIEGGRFTEAEALAEELYELDKVFPDVEPRWFTERQGRAG